MCNKNFILCMEPKPELTRIRHFFGIDVKLKTGPDKLMS